MNNKGGIMIGYIYQMWLFIGYLHPVSHEEFSGFLECCFMRSTATMKGMLHEQHVMRSMEDIDYRKVTFVPDVITQKLFS